MIYRRITLPIAGSNREKYRMKFQKGVSGNPKGPAPFRDLASMGYWLRRFEKRINHPDITQIQKAKLELDVITLLMARKDVKLPESKAPERTVKAKLFSIEDLEDGRSGEVSGDTGSVADGPIEVQAFKDSAGD